MKRTLVIPLLLGVLAATASVAQAAAPPSVTTGGASGVHSTSAVLNGTVNPHGEQTTYYFQWGPPTAYGSTSASRSAGNGTTAVPVQHSVSGLTPGTTYHYRLVASNSGGTVEGADRTFTTHGHPPAEVATGPVRSLGKTTAVLTGTINPHGAATAYSFQYGTSLSYGVETFSSTVPAGNSPVGVSVPLSGLAPGTVFHYRLVARRSGSVAYGGDQQFMTYPVRRPVPRVRARTVPGRATHKPFTFVTIGRISHPAWMPPTYACSGNVRVRWWLGRRKVKTTIVSLRPDCTFAAQTVFTRRPPRAPKPTPLIGFVTYLGTGYLAPAQTPHRRHITLE